MMASYSTSMNKNRPIHLQPVKNSKILERIWRPPARPLASGAWLWWFWLFFIHDNNTKNTGRCRQLMVLWSVKNDSRIRCNDLDLRLGPPIVANPGGWELDGAAAAWYYDGRNMHDDFVLHPSKMQLHARQCRLDAPPSSRFEMQGRTFVTRIRGPKTEFEFRALQADSHPAVGPTHGRTAFCGTLEVEGTRIERLELGGWEKHPGQKKRAIHGTAYFQKILLAAPPPAWYWGLYHFDDGSFATYMQVYAGRSTLFDNLWPHGHLRPPRLSLKEDLLIYHAPSRRVFEGRWLRVRPSPLPSPAADSSPSASAHPPSGLWRHDFSGGGRGFVASGQADSYAHACWSFNKRIGRLPVRSTFKYNEYPSLLRRLVVHPHGENPIVLENGWGNMENSWGFIV